MHSLQSFFFCKLHMVIIHTAQTRIRERHVLPVKKTNKTKKHLNQGDLLSGPMSKRSQGHWPGRVGVMYIAIIMDFATLAFYLGFVTTRRHFGLILLNLLPHTHKKKIGVLIQN